MSEANIVLPHLTGNQLVILWAVLASALVALLYGWSLARTVLAASPGAKSMTDVADAVEEGAMAYLRRQVKTMIWFVIVIALALFFMYRHVYPDNLTLSFGIAIAFLMGVSASYGAGFVGMKLAVKGNVRSANAALTSFKDAMEIAFKAGGVSGMFTVGFGLLGATIIFLVFQENAMKVLIGFGFGGSLAALFMRVGGGIYTKAADVGGDLVGKVEAGIPEDDPRNAATIADNVGDNVGDCAGMAADVFESYEVTLVAAIILAAYALSEKDFTDLYGAMAGAFAMKLIIFALILRAVGVFSSILGIIAVRVPPGRDARSDAPDQHRLHDFGDRLGHRLLHRQLALPGRPADRRDRLALRLVRHARHHSRHRHPVADQLLHPSRTAARSPRPPTRRAPARRR